MNAPVFIPFKKRAKFFMPHFPIFTGNLNSLDTSSITFLLEKLHNPQHKLKNVIHVVGTNGKGSSCAYLKHILNAGGFTTCVFTSPHLHRANERIDILGEYISDLELFTLTEKIRFLCEEHKINITLFESLTLVAILAFSKVKADFYIFEAGMGGELDATNIFLQNNIAGVLVTSISYDHVKFLGSNLNSIITHKLGVCKANKPVVFQPFSGEILYTILEQVAQKKAVPQFFGKDYNVFKVEFENGSFGIEFEGKRNLILPLPPLQGEHQIYNLAGVLALLEAIKVEVLEEQIAQGILNTKWAGRLEKVIEKDYISLLPTNSEIWFDGAHNAGGAQVASSWLKSQNPELINILIVSKTRGSEVQNFILAFKDVIEYGIAFEGKGEIYPEFATVLIKEFERQKIKHSCASGIKDALKQITKTIKVPVRVLICGSLYIARDLSFELM
jgi:dihydrofolate synthase / folylpolyglutamate synthase